MIYSTNACDSMNQPPTSSKLVFHYFPCHEVDIGIIFNNHIKKSVLHHNMRTVLDDLALHVGLMQVFQKIIITE